MNCPSRVDQSTLDNPDHNQSPSALSLHKNPDLNARANQTKMHDHRMSAVEIDEQAADMEDNAHRKPKNAVSETIRPVRSQTTSTQEFVVSSPPSGPAHGSSSFWARSRQHGDRFIKDSRAVLSKYAKFIGPGFMVSVAYIDPGTSRLSSSTGKADSVLNRLKRQLRY